jgi:glycosyltransferase involved in cell wall biosynthesis
VRILHLIPYMHPSAGGPPVVVDAWCRELKARGAEIEVLTTDSYSPGRDRAWEEQYRSAYPVTVLPCWGPRGFGYSTQMPSQLREKLQSCDLVHVHNLWSYCNRLAARLCPSAHVPFVVSPHGMLDPHSMGRKPWKKKLYGKLVEFPQLRKAAGLFFTHPEEERLARETCSQLPRGYVVPLGTEEPPAESREQLAAEFLKQFPDLADRERVVFLGRLHPKKGLDLLVSAFARVAELRPRAKLILIGPGDLSYVNELFRQVRSLNLAERVVSLGSLSGRDKWAALAAGEVYVLPSYQENFAIALVEALRIGTPVICSRRVNIWADLAAAGAATVCDLTIESVGNSILQLLQNPARSQDQSRNGAAFAAMTYTWPKSVDRLSQVYAQLITQKCRGESAETVNQ